MIYPRFWLKHSRVKRALKSYPLYDVRHKQSEQTLSEGEARENFDYFMCVRLQRLAFFRNWLRTNFGVVAPLDGDGIRALSRWVDDYGGGLIGDETYTMAIFADYQPRWEGVYAGYNVMIDIGIFLGEYLISKRPRPSTADMWKSLRLSGVSATCDRISAVCLENGRATC